MTLVDKRVNEARNRAPMDLKNTNYFAIWALLLWGQGAGYEDHSLISSHLLTGRKHLLPIRLVTSEQETPSAHSHMWASPCWSATAKGSACVGSRGGVRPKCLPVNEKILVYDQRVWLWVISNNRINATIKNNEIDQYLLTWEMSIVQNAAEQYVIFIFVE